MWAGVVSCRPRVVSKNHRKINTPEVVFFVFFGGSILKPSTIKKVANCTRGVDKLEDQGSILKPSTSKLHERG